MDTILDRPIKFLTGIGERRAVLLASEIGVNTFGDMLMHIPFRYIDRSRVYRISDINEELSSQYIQVRARVLDKGVIGKGPKARLAVVVADDTGEMDVVWFRGVKFLANKLEIGREYIFFGRSTMFNGSPNMAHPEFEPPIVVEGQKPMGEMQGIYSTTEKLSSFGLGTKAIFNVMRTLWTTISESIPETMPAYMLEQENLVSRTQALHDIHFPPSAQALNAALKRLKFEELFVIQLQLLEQRKIRTEKTKGYLMPKVGAYFKMFYHEKLPFDLTQAQQRVVREIRGDMVSGHQMNRLMQGDVGSGKTIVALLCILIAADNGFQSALMVPTEILANQHYRSILNMVEAMGLRVEVLTGSTRKKRRDEIAEGLLSGEIDLLIGTHALIEERVQFSRLGFVVIDEQHRFGVMQRAKLRLKSELPPHVLVMTATPIPRTLAMTLYGDLDVSVIDELPPGRKPIRTSHAMESHRLRMFGFMKEQIAQGKQIYIVYPLIKESETLDVANLEEGAEVIAREFPPPEYTSIVVHGKMPAKLKDYGMEQFKEGRAQILISTTVIEVGVDVPNASVMVIESAERFGLSQLHQLRGRVGRGSDQSYCILMTGYKLGVDARRRMEAMVSTTDGFRLSELDMQLRGAGDIDGTSQSGQGFDIKVANLAKDGDILEAARGVAERILADDPQLQKQDNMLLVAMLERLKKRREVDVDLREIS